MNKKLLIVGLVLLSVLGFAAYYYKNSRTNSEIDPSMVTNESQVSGSQTSLKDLLAQGVDQKCVFEGGVVYVTEGKVRTDINPDSHVIIDGSTSYMWSDNQNSGIKTIIDVNALIESDSEVQLGDENTNLDYKQQLNYRCEPWIVDSNMFMTPPSVKFQEIKNIMPSVNPNKSDDNTGSQCSYCEGLTGDSLTQCKAALNCN